MSFIVPFFRSTAAIIPSLLLLLLLLHIGIASLLLPVVEARLVGAILLPHGDEALDPTLLPPRTEARSRARQIAQASHSVGQWMSRQIDPDILFLTSPHGVALSTEFAVYLNDRARGSLHQVDYQNQSRTVTMDHSILLHPVLGQKLMNGLTTENVTGIRLPSDGSTMEMPLYWGEIVPLLFLVPARQPPPPPPHDESNATTNSRSRNLRTAPPPHRPIPTTSFTITTSPLLRRRHLIWTFPQRRYTHAAVDMVDELLRVGSKLFTFLELHPQRIGVVVSGDLSHTHRSDGPYGYSNTSAPFDAALAHWARNPCPHASALLETARNLQPTALSCGFAGYVLLHGMLCGARTTPTEATAPSSATTGTLVQLPHHAKKKNVESADASKPHRTAAAVPLAQWEGHVLVNLNATYFGMMAAILKRLE